MRNSTPQRTKFAEILENFFLGRRIGIERDGALRGRGEVVGDVVVEVAEQTGRLAFQRRRHNEHQVEHVLVGTDEYGDTCATGPNTDVEGGEERAFISTAPRPAPIFSFVVRRAPSTECVSDAAPDLGQVRKGQSR